MKTNYFIMKLNTAIRHCLEKGEIWVSSYGHILCIVLKQSGVVIARVNSEKGIHHATLMFLATVLDHPAYEIFANDQYKYPIGPSSITELDHFFLKKQFTRIYLTGAFIQIDTHQTSMPSIDVVPGLYYKRGRGGTFREAFEQMLKAQPTVELPLADPI